MIVQLAHNIVSPLGFTSEENFRKVKACQTACQAQGKLHENKWGLPEPFYGHLLDWSKVEDSFSQLPAPNIRLTSLEKISVLSAYQAIQVAGIDPSDPKVVFVYSTTKGNVSLLSDLQGFPPESVYLSYSAEVIKNYFSNPNPITVVSNACTSGVAAQLYAVDLLETQGYQTAVVIGADVLCPFIVSGFQSFKALSKERCKPFDLNRTGLNLGEGAATIILQKTEEPSSGALVFRGGGNRNDANHISGPSRTGEGLHNAIEKALAQYDRKKIAFINAHGTATPYNDDMESWAIERSNMSQTPVNSLKGYFGHTLGAAGIIECIISSLALKEQIVLPTLGHETKGVAKEINVNRQLTSAVGDSFLKIISGFGGSNAAILYEIIR